MERNFRLDLLGDKSKNPNKKNNIYPTNRASVYETNQMVINRTNGGGTYIGTSMDNDVQRYIKKVGKHIPIREARRNPIILRKKLDICIYLMSSVALKMEIEDGMSVTVHEIIKVLSEDEDLAFSHVTAQVFTLWMTSPLLALQLKPHHKPLFIRREWNHFLQRFSSAPLGKKALDEPVLSLQRDIFFPKKAEMKIRDDKTLELLYEEAKYNILTGRYPCEISDYIMLGCLQARLELGPYDSSVHTRNFFRGLLYRFLPEHATVSKYWQSHPFSWLPWKSNTTNSPENRFIEQLQTISSQASSKVLMRKYLKCCWNLPYYGCAFFNGQIESPTSGVKTFLINGDTDVLVAINSQGLYVIDPADVIVLLGLCYQEMSWDYAKPSQESNESCLPCLFIQFCVIENGRRVSKILQIFSRQAIQMDALIAFFVEKFKEKVAVCDTDLEESALSDTALGNVDDELVHLATVTRWGIPDSCLSNKLNRLSLATFDDEGHCIGHTGSWSFSS